MKFSRRQDLLEKWERATELPFLVLSVTYLLLLILPDVVPHVSSRVVQALVSLSWLIWGVFAFDLAMRVTLAPRRLEYLRYHWADVIIVAFPFLRPLKLLGILVLLVRTWNRSRAALGTQTLSFVGVSSLIIILLGAALVYLAERAAEGPIDSFYDALWWAVTTITTVGYGDMYPVTDVGRGTAVLVMLAGITAFGVATASFATLFQATPEQQEETELRDLKERLDRIERLLLELQRERKDA